MSLLQVGYVKQPADQPYVHASEETLLKSLLLWFSFMSFQMTKGHL